MVASSSRTRRHSTASAASPGDSSRLGAAARHGKSESGDNPYVPSMPVTAGQRLGPYEILAPLGAGGMGEVWRAHDTRLDRSVAIKLLPGEFAQNAQLKARFEREAKTISQLNHPNI